MALIESNEAEEPRDEAAFPLTLARSADYPKLGWCCEQLTGSCPTG